MKKIKPGSMAKIFDTILETGNMFYLFGDCMGLL
jgi:hypothetical protein